jgi:hypothetical protein
VIALSLADWLLWGVGFFLTGLGAGYFAWLPRRRPDPKRDPRQRARRPGAREKVQVNDVPKPKKKFKAKDITTAQFDDKLEEILDRQTGGKLLSIAGVYEVLSEHFNNEVIEELEREHGS